MELALIFIFGLFVGSFLNVVIYRLYTGEQFLRGRSHCSHCGHVLFWYELIPVISFPIQGAKCRVCRKPISWQYPLVELATGILFAFASWHIAEQIDFFSQPVSYFLFSIFYFLIIAGLIVISVYDLKHYIILDSVLLFLIIVTIVASVVGVQGLGAEGLEFRILNFEFVWDLGFRIWDLNALLNGLLLGVLSALPFLGIVLVSRGAWMGLGDAKFAFFMGMLLGLYALLAMFLAVILGAIMGLALIAIGKKTMQSAIPFGPFLVVGTFVSLFYGNAIWNFYLGLLGL